MKNHLKSVLLLSLFIFGYQNIANSATISFDQLAASSDLTTQKYNSDIDRVYIKVNSNIQTDNVADDTLTEPDFADDSNPRIRTAEGASCADFVYTGLLTTTTSGTLTGSVPAGTAYPDGYRVNKASSTPKTFTANRWTFVDLDINGNFTYSEVTVGGATPSIAPNSVRISRVSTDGTEVVAVQDLRTINCAAANFNEIKNSSTQANLGMMLQNGRKMLSADLGWVNGLQISYDTTTTFKIRSGTSYFTQSGEYRNTSSDITVTTGNDNPSLGTSGLDTSSIAASTTYCIYAVADEENVATLSTTYSTNCSAPAGVTNYRKIGEIKTDVNSNFTSRDMITTHRPGRILQSVYEPNNSYASFTTTVPFDDSIPTSSEGTQLMSVSIDPIRVGSFIDLEAKAYFGAVSTTVMVGGAIFRDSETSAIPGCVSFGAGNLAGGAVDANLLAISCRVTAQNAANTTFKFRAGPNSAATGYFNGNSSARYFGGGMASYMKATEVEK